MSFRSANLCLAGLLGILLQGCHMWGGGYDSSYSSCVQPDGCISCATGVYGTQIDPVQQARTQRARRARSRVRGRRFATRPYAGAYGHLAYAPHHMTQPFGGRRGHGRGYHPHVGGMLGYDDFGYGWDDGYCEPCCECDCSDGYVSGYGDEFIDGEVIYEGEWQSEGWTEGITGDCPHCSSQTTEVDGVPMEQHVEGARPLVPPEALTEEDTPAPPQPAIEEMSGFAPASDEYYMPRPLPTVPQVLPPKTSQVVEEPGDPVQPVLWVPTGL